MNDKILKAVALKYERYKDKAPKVVAKGKGKIAEKILQIAKENNIPIEKDEELVEILSSLDINDEIPPELYETIAKILVFIYKNSKKF